MAISTVDNYDPFGDNSGISLWQFENNANDTAGVNDGILTGTAGFSANGKFGSCLLTRASNNSNVEIRSNPVFQTVTMWFNNSTQRNNAALLAPPGTASTDHLLTLHHSDLILNNDPSLLIKSNIQEGVWYFVAIVFDDSGSCDIYVDGNLEATYPSDYNTLGFIGASYTNGYTSDTRYDQVRIFNRALTEEEVQILYIEEITPAPIFETDDFTASDDQTDGIMCTWSPATGTEPITYDLYWDSISQATNIASPYLWVPPEAEIDYPLHIKATNVGGETNSRMDFGKMVISDRPVFGSSEIDNLMLGSAQVDALYLGSNRVWGNKKYDFHERINIDSSIHK